MLVFISTLQEMGTLGSRLHYRSDGSNELGCAVFVNRHSHANVTFTSWSRVYDFLPLG